MKHQLLYLYHTYSRVLYEMHSGTFLQQLRKVKGNEYFEHSNSSANTIKDSFFFYRFFIMNKLSLHTIAATHIFRKPWSHFQTLGVRMAYRNLIIWILGTAWEFKHTKFENIWRVTTTSPIATRDLHPRGHWKGMTICFGGCAHWKPHRYYGEPNKHNALSVPNLLHDIKIMCKLRTA